MLLTLTLAPERFNHDPRAAFLHITGKKFISRLLEDRLGVTRYVSVLEFQQNGWPHWHLLIDAPGGFFDLEKAWEIWGWQKESGRGRWGFGGLHLGTKMQNGLSAVLYMAKYLTKPPRHGYPDWLLDLDRRVRWVNPSREVGPVTESRQRASSGEEDPSEDEAAIEGRRVKRSLRERVARCGRLVDLLRETIDTATGQISLRWVGRMSAEAVEVARLQLTQDENGGQYTADPGDIRQAIAACEQWLYSADAYPIGKPDPEPGDPLRTAEKSHVEPFAVSLFDIGPAWR
jgi:hypothetical protein